MSLIYFTCANEITEACTQATLTKGSRVAYLAFNTRANALALLRSRAFNKTRLYQVETENVDKEFEVRHYPCQQGFLYLITDTACTIDTIDSGYNKGQSIDQAQLILTSILAFELRLKQQSPQVGFANKSNLPSDYQANVNYIRQIIASAEKSFKRRINSLQRPLQQHRLVR